MSTLNFAQYKSGTIYNRLMLTGKSCRPPNRKRLTVEYICSCGAIGWAVLYKIFTGSTKSCGCLNKDNTIKRNTTHNLSKHPLYKSWLAIRARCLYGHDPDYIDVKICDQWEEFIPFYNWAIANGWEEGLQIDKDIIPKKLGIPAVLYSPEMCCFVTQLENIRNRTNTVEIEYKGVKKSLGEWCEILNISYGKVWQRIYTYGWDIESALTN